MTQSFRHKFLPFLKGRWRGGAAHRDGGDRARQKLAPPGRFAAAPLIKMGGSLAAALVLTAAAPAPSPFQTLYENEKRIATIAYRIQSNGGALCPDKMPLWGVVLHDRAQYAKADRAAASAYFKLGDLPSILAIVPDSPADRAQMREGDTLMGIDNHRLPRVPADASGYATIAAVEAKLDAAGPRATFDLVGYRSMMHPITLTKGCRSRVQIVAGRKLNASADGFYVQLTHAMIGETKNDDELAFVIAHEMAHNILGHVGKRMPGKVKETEADILALKLMRAARYDVNAAPRFWARFGDKTGYGIFSDGSHLRTKARVRLLESEAAKLTQ